MAGLVVAGFAGGLCEASLLAVIAQAAVTISARSSASPTGLPIVSHLGVPLLLSVAATLAIIRLAMAITSAWLNARIGSDLQVLLRAELVEAYLASTWAAKSQLRQGSMQESVTSLVDRAAGGAAQLAVGISSALSFAILIGVALVAGPIVALLATAVACGLFFALKPLMTITHRWSAQFTEAHALFAGQVAELERLAVEHETFGSSIEAGRRLNVAALEIRRPSVRRASLMAAMPGAYQSFVLLLAIGSLAFVYSVGGTDVAVFAAVALLLVRSFAYSQMTQAAYQALTDLAPAITAIDDEVSSLMARSRPPGVVTARTFDSLRLEEVAFAYDGRPLVFRHLGLDVSRGEAVGLVGPSGTGKSTLLQLCLRLRQPSRGRILLNGADVDEIRSDDWASLISFVPQEPHLVQGTVAENIAFLRPIARDQLVSAARAAGVHEELLALPQGYDTPLDERTAALSGGQKQRLCLARALAGQPQLLLLDEPTSALDAESEALVRASLENLRGSTTLLIVAHRTSTLDLCDRILRLDKGELTEVAVKSASRTLAQ